MIPPDPLVAYQNAPLADLLAILLRQFKRPLATHGVHLSDPDAEALARQIAERAPLGDRVQAVRAALIDLIAESEQVLAQWHLTFQQSLDTEMNDIPGWTSTAEFLDIANQKANAELRISTGSALLTALGDFRHAPELLSLIERPDADLDAVIARRVLLLASAVDGDDPAWLDKLRAWIDQQPNRSIAES